MFNICLADALTAQEWIWMPATNQAIQQDRRKLLIDATITAIAEYGLSQLTLAKISSIAGLTAGTVNFHFDSKESLLLETLNFVSQEFENSIAQALEQCGSNPAKRLAAIINTTHDPDITEYRKMAVWHAFDSESRAREDYQLICGARDRQSFAIILELCEQIIRQQNKEAEINARAIANAICGLNDELWKEILFASENYDRDEARNVCMRFLASIFPWCYEMPAVLPGDPQATMCDPVSVVKAGAADLDQASALFDLYRQFYEQKANPALAREYLGERLSNGDSVIFLALDNKGSALGFTQLYSSYCSVAAKPIWILYDLYVDSTARKNGVAKALMNRALLLARETGACRIDLETASDNIAAQALYESLGYERDQDFYKYSLEI